VEALDFRYFPNFSKGLINLRVCYFSKGPKFVFVFVSKSHFKECIYVLQAMFCLCFSRSPINFVLFLRY